jgi:hypothetical protein
VGGGRREWERRKKGKEEPTQESAKRDLGKGKEGRKEGGREGGGKEGGREGRRDGGSGEQT